MSVAASTTSAFVSGSGGSAERSGGGPPPAVMQLVLSLTPGGTERLVIDLVTRLSSRFRMVVCCLDDVGGWASEVRASGVPVVPLHRAPGFHPGLGRRVADLAARHSVSVIHAHHYSPFVYGRIAAWTQPALGLVYTEHGRLSDAPPTLKRRLANRVLGRFDGPVFAVSEALKRHMVAEGFPARRVGVIHNGIDLGAAPTDADRQAARSALGLGDDRLVVGTAARLDPVKDLGTLLAAVALLRARVGPVTTVIMGDGDERATLEATARAAGIAEDVRFLGYRSDVRRLLPALDVYVNCSVSEGVSLTILEAMATSLPVVATRVGGTPEVVLDGETGILVGARQADALADSIARLAASPDVRRTLGLAARRRVADTFTIDRMVDDYAREYAKMGRS